MAKSGFVPKRSGSRNHALPHPAAVPPAPGERTPGFPKLLRDAFHSISAAGEAHGTGGCKAGSQSQVFSLARTLSTICHTHRKFHKNICLRNEYSRKGTGKMVFAHCDTGNRYWDIVILGMHILNSQL